MSRTILAERFPQRASVWQLRSRRLIFSQRPLLMGIVNVTPDSFSDGGRFFEPSRAIEHGLRLAAEGADLLDVGGESTRPYAQPIAAAEELRRVVPVVQALCEQLDVPVSIDTSKALVAREAVAAGAEIINDVTGLVGDPEMLPSALDGGVGICVMHIQGTPQTMQDQPTYRDVVEEIYEYLRVRRDVLLTAGVDRARICLDPGVGFGKTHQHNLTLLAGCGRYHKLGCPVLVGPSRKGFIGRVLGSQVGDRKAGTIGVCLALAAQGVQVLRVHDVEPVRQALRMFEAIGGITGHEVVLDQPG
ncbi:MAG: dihydropteroate synthase [Planctomycetota bacterium]|nr:dihydropteroate synthase [Planctomycetota bacterium]